MNAVELVERDGYRGVIYVDAYAENPRNAFDAEAFADDLAEDGALWQAYVNGEVYGYVVEDPDGEYVESCWGYYGDRELDYVRSLINEAIDGDRDRIYQDRVAMFRRLIERAA